MISAASQLSGLASMCVDCENSNFESSKLNISECPADIFLFNLNYGGLFRGSLCGGG